MMRGKGGEGRRHGGERQGRPSVGHNNPPLIWVIHPLMRERACLIAHQLLRRFVKRARAHTHPPSSPQLRSWMNPGCDEYCQRRNVTTLYLRADGANDTLHYLWDFAVGRPSVLLALTPSSAWLNITWPDYLDGRNNSVYFSEPAVYTFGMIVNKVNIPCEEDPRSPL